MSNYIITTDSGSDLTQELYTKYDIIPIMMEYEVGGRMHLDTPNESEIKKFYNTMREGAVPKTTQINANRMVDFFTDLVNKYNKPIMHISLGSGISGTCHNCMAAAKEVTEKTGVKITVVDSIGASLCDGLLCIIASENRENGMTLENNVEFINDIKHKINVYFTTNTLTYLHRGGRVSKTSAVLGHMLGINPVLTLDTEGHLIVCDKVRGEKNTIDNIIKKIADTVLDASEHCVYISHSDCYDRAVAVGEKIKAEIGFKDVVITNIGTIIGAHTGPGLVAIFYYGKERTIQPK